ncbi:MAG: hypothetical protein A2136_04665 [Chloroflexi bacterium RBG_16_54_11]|nr:MAG: hypothetical protein A2136_04665 [Chloroflexi bacterium RBG_16_54_11]
MSEDKGIETLIVWQKAMAFAIHVQQQIIPLLPKDEKWALGMQMRRSAQSIPANIAEGYGRYYYQEGVRFCYLARGSLEETYTHLSLAYELGYISKDAYSKSESDIQELRRLLNGYISFLKKSKRGDNEPGSAHRIQDDPSHYLLEIEQENEDRNSGFVDS